MKLNDEERNGIKQLIIKDKKTKQNKININKKIMIKFKKKTNQTTLLYFDNDKKNKSSLEFIHHTNIYMPGTNI